MLRKSDRFLPPQAEEDEAAVEGEQDADEDAVCRSIRPTMSGRELTAGRDDQPPPTTGSRETRRRGGGRTDEIKLLARTTGRREPEIFVCRPRAEAAASPSRV